MQGVSDGSTPPTRCRFDQARAVVDRTVPADRLMILMGFSMSGQTIADLLALYRERVHAIALCAPAVYAADAWEVPFGDGFTELIRRPESWREPRALEAFRAFAGRAVLVLPELDAVIPGAVTKLVSESLAERAGAEFDILQIAGCLTSARPLAGRAPRGPGQSVGRCPRALLIGDRFQFGALVQQSALTDRAAELETAISPRGLP